MKKIISLLLCFALLFSFAAFAAAEEPPQLTLSTSKMRTDAYDSAAGVYVSFRFAVTNCPDFENFQVKITYNPEVLELYRGYPFDLEAVERNSIEFTQESDGTVIADGLKYEYAYKGEFDPFCLKVIGAGDTNISVELVSFRTADGEIKNVVFDASVLNFTATRKDYTTPTVCITAQDAVSFSEHSQRIDCLFVSILNVEDFARCEINVTLNTPPYSLMPRIMDLASSNSSTNCKSGIQKQQDGSYTITLNAPVENADIPYAAFTFKSNEDVPLAFTVNSVNLYTADGEIAKNDFILDEQRLNGAGDFVRYDLDGDDIVTAEDARLALRFAVGLDTATDAQCRAVGVTNAKSFTSEDARFILRCAVGLEDDVAKVVTEVYWSGYTFEGYIVYTYSDGTHDTIGLLNDRPDWI